MYEEEYVEKEDIVDRVDLEKIVEEFNKECWFRCCYDRDLEEWRNYVYKYWNEISDNRFEELYNSLKEKISEYSSKVVYDEKGEISVDEDYVREVNDLFAAQRELLCKIKSCFKEMGNGFKCFRNEYSPYGDFVECKHWVDDWELFVMISNMVYIPIIKDGVINNRMWRNLNNKRFKIGSMLLRACKILIRHLDDDYHYCKMHTDLEYYRECYYNNLEDGE